MKKKPFLSIIMPVYNAERYLNESISCILEQKFQDFELIIVNDKSTDYSGRICDSYAQKDDRISVIHLEKNGGAGNARNIGIQKASADYLTFIDADDVIEEDLYFNAFTKAIQYSADIVVWGLTEEYYSNKGEVVFKNYVSMPEQICQNRQQVRDAVIKLEEKTLFGYQCNRFYRSNIIKENGIHFESVILYEDYFFNLEVINHVENMVILSDIGYHYLKRSSQSVTAGYVPEYFELSSRRICSMYEAYLKWGNISQEVINILGERYLRYILAGLVKSFDKRAKMKGKERKTWLQSVVRSDLYGNLSQVCTVGQKKLYVFQKVLNGKHLFMGIQIGKVIWLMREKFPVLFDKLRRYK